MPEFCQYSRVACKRTSRRKAQDLSRSRKMGIDLGNPLEKRIAGIDPQGGKRSFPGKSCIEACHRIKRIHLSCLFRCGERKSSHRSGYGGDKPQSFQNHGPVKIGSYEGRLHMEHKQQRGRDGLHAGSHRSISRRIVDYKQPG